MDPLSYTYIPFGEAIISQKGGGTVAKERKENKSINHRTLTTLKGARRGERKKKGRMGKSYLGRSILLIHSLTHAGEKKSHRKKNRFSS